MPRLDQVPKADVQDAFTLQMYEFMFGDRDPVAEPGAVGGTIGDWWTVMAQSPAALRHAVRGFKLYRQEVKIRPDHRELGQIRAGWVVGSQFVFSQHCKACRSAGLSEEKIAAIPSWQVADCYDDTERLVLAYTDCLAGQHGRVPDELFRRLREVFTDSEILELTYVTHDVHPARDHGAGVAPGVRRPGGPGGRGHGGRRQRCARHRRRHLRWRVS